MQRQQITRIYAEEGVQAKRGPFRGHIRLAVFKVDDEVFDGLSGTMRADLLETNLHRYTHTVTTASAPGGGSCGGKKTVAGVVYVNFG